MDENDSDYNHRVKTVMKYLAYSCMNGEGLL